MPQSRWLAAPRFRKCTNHFFPIRAHRAGVVRSQELADELLTPCPFTATSPQWHRKHTSMGKERSLGRLAATALWRQRASRQQRTKRNGERRAIASHREAQGFAKKIAPQTEVHGSITLAKLPYQERQQIMV